MFVVWMELLLGGFVRGREHNCLVQRENVVYNCKEILESFIIYYFFSKASKNLKDLKMYRTALQAKLLGLTIDCLVSAK